MKKFFMHFFILSLNLFLSPFFAHGAASKSEEAAGEVLVANDIGKGGTVKHPKWCGNNSILFKGEKAGIVLIDLETKRAATISADKDDWPLNCSPDGRWVVYVNDRFRTVDPGDKDPPAKMKEIYRYEVETGKATRFAASPDLPPARVNAVSPDGKKVYLGSNRSHTLDEPQL